MDTHSQRFIQELTDLSVGLLYMSESDFPLEPFIWTREEFGASEATPESLAQLLNEPHEVFIEPSTPDAFWEPMTTEQDWFGDEEKEISQRFRALEEFLNKNLSDLKVFKVGEVEKSVYVIGITPQGDIAGVKTTVIET